MILFGSRSGDLEPSTFKKKIITGLVTFGRCIFSVLIVYTATRFRF